MPFSEVMRSAGRGESHAAIMATRMAKAGSRPKKGKSALKVTVKVPNPVLTV